LTPLNFASDSNSTEVVKYLLNRGVNISSAKNKTGWRAIDYAHTIIIRDLILVYIHNKLQAQYKQFTQERIVKYCSREPLCSQLNILLILQRV